MLVLGVETSCDETSCAIVKDGRIILSNIIASQVKSHAPYGGVVPELASRLHIENCIPILDRTLEAADLTLSEIDLFSVTAGPGLVGSLLVGVELAKALSYVCQKPLIPIHHIAGHLYTPFLASELNHEDNGFDYPYLGLVVSGGHSSIILVKSPLVYEEIGRTLDDAAGEAFDKVAKLMGLGYPGGPMIDRLSEKGDPQFVDFPRPGSKSDNCDLSFSGLKTAVVRYAHNWKKDKESITETDMANVAASFQFAVIDTLLGKTRMALEKTGMERLAIVGGVACNRTLRREAFKMFSGIRIHIPPPVLCTDNAAMIAGLAPHYFDAGKTAPLTLNADVNLRLY
ncbi:tRNA (adenosine(37)-N6)-threonylcarbamoyltransferase complex transferase subunit TsaD [Candidatus Sumerlaeota bacterium]|nr:tRNA (adenosine(37)-N6)-threonylcarbamoyltransferase complex transferase subunit TsaD [Candidatus Sumerlaeota bacterium]